MSMYESFHDPEFDPYAAPSEKIKASLPITDGGIWNDRKLLVMDKTAVLPDRCVKCDAPAEGYRLRRNLSWHPWGYYLIILLNLILYVIVALIVRYTAKIEIGLCPVHRAKRRNTILICWGLFFLGFFLIAMGISSERQQEVSTTVYFISGIAALLISLIWGLVGSQPITPRKIDKQFIWLNKVCPEFRADLPQWPGSSEIRW